MQSNGNDVEITVEGASDLDTAARSVFRDAIARYAKDLLNEASHSEAARNRGSSPVIQYTTGDVAQAEPVVRNRGLPPARLSPIYFWERSAQWFLTAVAGLTGGLLPTWFGWGYFLAASGVGALLLTVHLEYKNWKDRR
jgi:anti-sigma factor RsiW